MPGEVPSDCFPKVDDRNATKSTKRVSFAQGDQPSKVPVDLPTLETEDQPMDEQRDLDLPVGSPVPPPASGGSNGHKQSGLPMMILTGTRDCSLRLNGRP